MRLEDLEVFLTIVQQGNLHRAALSLGHTQSALSKTLARLEAEVGMQLFERTARGLDLTPAGQALQSHAAKVSLAVGDLRADLADQRQAKAGQVRIGVLPSLMSSVLSPLFARFITHRPLATFSIESHLSARLLQLLQNAEVDLVLAALPDEVPADLAWRSLGPLRLRIVLRHDHPRRDRLHSLADLSEERWALPPAKLYLRQWLDLRFTRRGLPPPRATMESSGSPSVFAELLRQSELLGVMPLQVLAQAEGQGLVALEGADMEWERELAVFWRSSGYLSPVSQDFLDSVEEWT